jgi:flagellar hook-basal body complex protein FliE
VTVGPIPAAPAPLTFEPDAPVPRAASPAAGSFADAFGGALAAASSALERADQAESAFVRGRGGLQEMVIERAQADVLLAIASSAASRTAQSLATLLNMQL